TAPASTSVMPLPAPPPCTSKRILGCSAEYCSAHTVIIGNSANAPETAMVRGSPPEAGASAAPVDSAAASVAGCAPPQATSATDKSSTDNKISNLLKRNICKSSPDRVLFCLPINSRSVVFRCAFLAHSGYEQRSASFVSRISYLVSGI